MPTLQDVFQCDHPAALITGSGSPRVGREIAGHLAELGCGIALHANTSVSDAQDAATQFRDRFGCEVIVTSGSLTESTVPARLVQETHAHFGRIDILVNSAAIWTPTKLDAITWEEVRNYFEINSMASFFCARAAAARMADQPSGGSIVNIGDWATVRPYLDHAAYFPSKGAIETMTRSLAVEVAQWNRRIRVNCVQPGPVLLADDVPDEDAQRIAASTLVGRVGTPGHIAHAVQFLCENDFVTGVCFPVDGGRSVFAPDGLQVGLNSG
jgi:NAD(P)-dependent dehydrogenase (short-subunit alcohol dehydrogenase family)